MHAAAAYAGIEAIFDGCHQLYEKWNCVVWWIGAALFSNEPSLTLHALCSIRRPPLNLYVVSQNLKGTRLALLLRGASRQSRYK